MLHTFPDAEFSISGVTEDGARTWLWMEFGLYIPYFLVTLQVESNMKSGTISLTRHLFLTAVEQILDLKNQQNSSMKIQNLSLMSPGYMNGSNDYELAQIKEIWSYVGCRGHMFVLTDGRSLSSPESTSGMEKKLEFSLQS